MSSIHLSIWNYEIDPDQPVHESDADYRDAYFDPEEYDVANYFQFGIELPSSIPNPRYAELRISFRDILELAAEIQAMKST